jgi:ubiquitin carboxyl-terminal hydrolase 7
MMTLVCPSSLLHRKQEQPSYSSSSFSVLSINVSSKSKALSISILLEVNIFVRGVDHLYVQKHQKVGSILSQLKQMVQIPETDDICVYEEIKSTMIDPVDLNLTFQQAELQDGDILCIQRKLTPEEEAIILECEGKSTVDAFLAYELGKVQAFFAPVSPDEDLPEFRLILHKDMGYEQIASIVAKELGIDGDKIRLINPYTQNNRVPHKRFSGMKLGKLMANAYTPNGGALPPNKVRLLYEKLDVSLEEMESKCPVQVTVCAPTLKDLQVIEVLLPKESGIDDLKQVLITRGAKLPQDLNLIRIFDEMDGKFDKEFDDKLWKAAISTRPAIKVYAEQIPEEELVAGDNGSFINVFHFQRTLNRTHSVPFKFLLQEVSIIL